jgi:hypothetical protein
MADETIVNVQYNIPRYLLGKPGKQNRACTGEMRVSPGITEPFEFVFMNSDGVAINLVGQKALVTFYFPQNQYDSLSANLNSNIVLAKYILIDDPYSGTGTLVLTDQETLTLARTGRSTLRWCVTLIDSQGNYYAQQITSSGERYGILHLDRSEIPTADILRGITISK